ncbi:MAG: hypothetical protein ACI9DF_001677 [Verrucomicrobiales bacterium]|jgi:hypothetical protein
MKYILTLLAAFITTASAHPGHTGHEDWPFDDFSWSMAAAIGIAAFLLIRGVIVAKRLARESAAE